MSQTKIPQLHKITALVKFVHRCKLSDLTGVKDSPEKICACYMAKRVTKLTNKEIASFFNIYHKYMQNCVENYAIALLLDPEGAKVVNEMERLFYEIELASVRS